jgi:hypothetical protein
MLSIGSGRLSELRMQHVRGFTELELVSLDGPVTDECLTHLARLHRLNELFVTDNYPNGVKVTDAGLAHIGDLRYDEAQKLVSQGFSGILRTIPVNPWESKLEAA